MIVTLLFQPGSAVLQLQQSVLLEQPGIDAERREGRARAPADHVSNRLDRRIEQITDSSFRFNQSRHAGIGFQFAAEPQDLNVNAAIEHILMHARGLHQMFAAERTTGGVEKGDQQRVLGLGQGHGGVFWIAETA